MEKGLDLATEALVTPAVAIAAEAAEKFFRKVLRDGFIGYRDTCKYKKNWQIVQTKKGVIYSSDPRYENGLRPDTRALAIMF